MRRHSFVTELRFATAQILLNLILFVLPTEGEEALAWHWHIRELMKDLIAVNTDGQ